MKSNTASNIDFEKYRLRQFVERLIDMGEVEIHDEPVPLTGLSAVIEGTQKAVLFKRAGPEQVEMVAKTAGNRKRMAAAFETSEDKVRDEYSRRLANPQPVVEVPANEAPVHEFLVARVGQTLQGVLVDGHKHCEPRHPVRLLVHA